MIGGAGVSGSAFVDNAAFRAYAFETFGARVLDMESAAVAHVAWANRVPFVAVRSLSDLAGGSEQGNQLEVFLPPRRGQRRRRGQGTPAVDARVDGAPTDAANPARGVARPPGQRRVTPLPTQPAELDRWGLDIDTHPGRTAASRAHGVDVPARLRTLHRPPHDAVRPRTKRQRT